MLPLICSASCFACGEHAGRLGIGSVVLPFSKASTIEDISGLSSMFSWVQERYMTTKPGH